MKQALFIVASVTVCLCHTIMLPYKNNLANIGEAFLLGSLSIIAAFQAMAASSVQTIGSATVVIATIIYTGIAIFYLLFNAVYGRWKARKDQGPDSQRPSRNVSSVDINGKPYNIPKRLFFPARKVKEPKVTEDGERLLQEPLVRGGTPEDF